MKDRQIKKTSYEDFFLRSLDTILMVSPKECKVLEANPASKNLLNLEKDENELIGNLFCSFVSERDVNNFKKQMRICSRRHHPRSFETIIKLKDGVKKNIKISACAVSLDDGEKVVEMIIKDITREKEIEAELQNYVMLLEHQNNYDSKTNIPNMRHFEKKLKEEHARAERSEGKYSLLFMDIDNFKNYNDTNGHEAGDECLLEVANIIKDSIRRTDFAARYGGEEFVVICPDTDADGAFIVAEKIRENIQNASIKHMEKQPKGFVSVSIGVAEYPVHGKDPDQIRKLADSALYHSKENGRNKVSIFKDFMFKEDLAS